MRIPKEIKYTKDDSIIESSITIDEYETISMPYLEHDIEINDKLIKKIEKMIRSSIEYRDYIHFLKDELNMNKCSLFQSLDYYDVDIHMHHGPLTLYDITDIVIRKQTSLHLNVTVFDVAEEVMRLHYENRVGLIPISKTVHDLLHQGEVFIPIQYFYGNYKSFYNEYNEYFTKDQINHLKEYIKQSREITKDQQIPDILQRKYQYLIVEGIELPKKIKQDKEPVEWEWF